MLDLTKLTKDYIPFWHSIHNTDILNYYMHKYVEAVKLLLEFILLYEIKLFLKKWWKKSILYCWIIARVQV